MNRLNYISITGANGMRSTVILISGIFLLGMAHATGKNDWTGLYGGINAGTIFNDASLNSNNLGFSRPNGTCNTSSSFSGFRSGFQGGYSRQVNSNLILGLEIDYSYNFNQQGYTGCTCAENPGVADQFAISNQQQKSLQGRIGYALGDHLLPFFSLGKAIANVGMNYRNEGGDYYSKNTSILGWLVGAGLEWRVSPVFSIRAEYSNIDYHNSLNIKIPMIYELYDPNGGAHVNFHANTLGVAFNYWF